MTPEQEQKEAGRRRWLAVILATVLMLMAYVVFVFAASLMLGEETVFAGGLLGIGLGLVPLVFAAAAFVSGNSTTLRSALAASGLWFVVAVPLFFFDFPTALVAGFGAGGIVAFRREPEHSWKTRAVAVAICAVYTFALQRLSLSLGLFAGAALPFLAIAAADIYKERAAAD